MFTCIICFKERGDKDKGDERIHKNVCIYGYICKKCFKGELEWMRKLIERIKLESGYGPKDIKPA